MVAPLIFVGAFPEELSKTVETNSKSVILGPTIVLVGRARFELAVSWSQTRRFTELSYRPRVSN